MEQRTTVGIDLAKEVFAICVLSPQGAVVEARTMRRAAFERWLAGLQGGIVVAMEACSSAHHWGRQLGAAGHTVRLMAPAFVVPGVSEFLCVRRLKTFPRRRASLATNARRGGKVGFMLRRCSRKTVFVQDGELVHRLFPFSGRSAPVGCDVA